MPDPSEFGPTHDPRTASAESQRDNQRYRRLIIGLAALAFTWRLYFVLRFPSYTPDSQAYDDLAQKWLAFHLYGMELSGRLTPVDYRLPGYPGFLALIYAVAGFSQRTVMVMQAILDTVTCLLAGRLARNVSPRSYAQQAETWTVTIAAVCPFLPCYAASILTEVPTTFFLTAALLAAVVAFRRGNWWAWLGAGVLTGMATLFRPESILLGLALGITLLSRYRARSQWLRLWRAGLIYWVGLGLTLVPWTVRNAITLHEFQPLAPRYANLPGEYVPLGYCRWVRTWLVRYQDSNEGFWPLNEGPILIANLPASAFDSPEERTRVAALLEQYNTTDNLTPELDHGFAEIAAERIARHPVRYYLTAPLGRAASMWFTPRVETLEYMGDLWASLHRLDEDWEDFAVSLTFGGINLVLVGLAVLGVLAWRGQLAFLDLLLAWILLRTAFLTTVETPEPRYVLECFPAVFVLAAFGALALRARFRPAWAKT